MAAAEDASFIRFTHADTEQSIPSRFARQVARDPARLAAGFGTESLSYEALHRLSNRIANALLDRCGPALEPVALRLPQGLELIAAILGVLKAGKCYLPLEPAHPAAHNALIMEESGTRICVTAGSGAPAASGVVDYARLAAHPAEHAPGLAIPPDALACIYYTSGSTGRPKGVCDSHRNVLHNIMRYTNSLRITAGDRLTLLQSPPFSGAVSSLFGALLNGAAVFPFDLRKEGMGRRLGEWLQREEITIYHSVPAVFRSFLSGPARFPRIRIVRLEGDAASRTDVELFREHFPSGAVLVNGLGATETGIVRQFFLSADTPLDDGVLPIGYATEDMHGLILDDDGNEVPRGTIGEFAVRSRYLATGYWRQPELTRAAFVPTGHGERVYRTGDLGRMRPDGCVEYLGRRNAQPKIRGHRVEPVEVESALLGLGSVREAAVVSREDARGAGELVAYLVPAPGQSLTPDMLRARLAGRVPDYMIPGRFVFLDRMPLNDNGKVDRRALPAPESLPRGRATAEPPGDPLEARLVEIWERILHRHSIGVTDDFFALGGDSVHGAEVLTALEELGEHDLPPSSLVDAPTIRQLAGVLRKDGVIRATALVPIQPRGSRPPFFMVHGHTGRVGTFGDLPAALGLDQPFYGLQSVGWWAGRAPHTTIESMAEHYITEIRRVQPAGPYLLGGDCYGSLVALEMAHRLSDRGERIALLCFVFNSPGDFPGLVPELIRKRFQLHARWSRVLASESAGRIRGHREALSGRDWRDRVGYLAALLGRVWGRLPQARGPLLPPITRRASPHPDVSEVNLLAQKAHRPRSWPGRVTLILRAEDVRRYPRGPSRAWGRVALGGYDIHFVPWENGLAFRAPRVQVLAGHLASAIRHSTA